MISLLARGRVATPISRTDYFKRQKVSYLGSGNEFCVYKSPHVVVKVLRSLEDFQALFGEVMRYGEMKAMVGNGGINPKSTRDRCLMGYKAAKEKAGGLVPPLEMPDWLEFDESKWIFGSDKHFSREAIIQPRIDKRDILNNRLEKALSKGDYTEVALLLEKVGTLLDRLIQRGTFCPDIRIDNFAFFQDDLMLLDCSTLAYPRKCTSEYVGNKIAVERHQRLWKEFLMANARHRDRAQAETVTKNFLALMREIYNRRYVLSNLGSQKPVPAPDVFPLIV